MYKLITTLVLVMITLQIACLQLLYSNFCDGVKSKFINKDYYKNHKLRLVFKRQYWRQIFRKKFINALLGLFNPLDSQDDINNLFL